MAFPWLANDGPLIVEIAFSHQLKNNKKNKTKKQLSKLNPIWQNFLDPRMNSMFYWLRYAFRNKKVSRF